MIDQNELLELLQIKQQLMTQQQPVKAQQVKPLYEGTGFQSALFVAPPKTEFKETETNISKTNSTSDNSSESGDEMKKETKVRSQIISAPKQTSLFSMDFLDESQDNIAKSQLSHRSQEKEQLDEDLMKLIDESQDNGQVTSAIDTLAQNFKGLDLS